MGCCCSAEESNGLQDEEVNERSRLLADPIRRSASDPVAADASDCSMKTGSPPQKTDKHQALSDILDQTARDIIDVAQMDNSVSEHHDHQDRAKKYSDKLYNNTMFPQQLPALTMKDVSNVERMLGGQPLPPSEYAYMVDGSAACCNAVQSVEVHPRDDLLVPFAVRA